MGPATRMNFIIRHFNIKWRTTKAAAATGNVVLIILFNESAGMGGGGEELTGSNGSPGGLWWLWGSIEATTGPDYIVITITLHCIGRCRERVIESDSVARGHTRGARVRWRKGFSNWLPPDAYSKQRSRLWWRQRQRLIICMQLN